MRVSDALRRLLREYAAVLLFLLASCSLIITALVHLNVFSILYVGMLCLVSWPRLSARVVQTKLWPAFTALLGFLYVYQVGLSRVPSSPLPRTHVLNPRGL